jgi:fluoride ion exporter CrcB/FEX
MNWLAILCAGAAYWVLGALWYSKLFSKPWSSAIEQHGIKLRASGFAMKLLVTFIANVIAALVLGRLFHQLQVIDVLRGVKIGAAIGVGFCGTALTMTYIWQSPPTRLWAIDTGFHIVGFILMGAILSAWP